MDNSTHRILVALSVLFGLSAVVLGVLYAKKGDFSDSFTNPYPMIDPLRTLVPQEHFITNIQPLREELYAISDAAAPNEVGIYFEFLNTGANISISQETRFWPASLSKMPTAMVVMKKVEDGEWNLYNELVMFPEDRDDKFGDLYKNAVGTRFTVETLLTELLVNSDDTAHRILIRNLTADDFGELIDGLGLAELYDADYNITAKEYSRIFRSLYVSSFLSREYSQRLLTWLSETPFDSLLGSGIPDSVTFSHKIGIHDPEQTYLDSGIAYIPNRPFLLTVMVRVNDGGGQASAEAIMGDISKAVYNYVTTY